MNTEQIDYTALVQGALLGVIRDLLADAAVNGLPGGHHFYLAFSTTHPGVDIPGYLREQHPDEMTIVLQNQFWDLQVNEEGFSVKLSFHSKPETLRIPFAALTGFLDPSVQFGLQFKGEEEDEAGAPSAGTGAAPVPAQQPEKQSEEATEPEAEPGSDDEGDNIVTLENFRKS
ncbi:MAG: ClpXP protease specificity-enhancing factor SspB [Alphaproteobacteria bacterium]|nr:ClpXP protease specificity-enhancing factor SspB [Alphaproteobacteria bacterium]